MVHNENLEIHELVAGVKSGEIDAFSALMQRFSPLMKAVCRKFGSSEIDDDTLQEAVFALYRAARSFDETQDHVSFGLYAKVCITNALITKLKSDHKNSCVVCSLYEIGEDVRDNDGFDLHADEDLSEALIQRERVEHLIENAHNNLSEYEIAVFHLYIEGRKPKDIAVLLGKSEKSVSNAINRFKGKLRQLI